MRYSGLLVDGFRVVMQKVSSPGKFSHVRLNLDRAKPKRYTITWFMGVPGLTATVLGSRLKFRGIGMMNLSKTVEMWREFQD
jgi:hypothetical protein